MVTAGSSLVGATPTSTESTSASATATAAAMAALGSLSAFPSLPNVASTSSQPTTTQGTAPVGPASPTTNPTADTGATPKGASRKDKASVSWDKLVQDDKRAKARAEKSSRARKMQSDVMAALWPNPDKIKEFRLKTGTDPDPAKLLSNLTFRDPWTDFQKAPTPGARSRLDKLAQKLMTPKGDSSKQRDTSRPTEKRKHSTSSSAASTSTERQGAKPKTSPPIKHLPKIPKINKEALKSNKSSEANPSDEDEDIDTMEVVDETEIPPLSDFHTDMAQSLPTFRDVAKGKKKLSSQHVLFVHADKEVRRKISRKEWALLLKKINSKYVTLAMKGEPTPLFEWTGYSKGVGLVACTDRESLLTAKEDIGSLTVAEREFRAWEQGETGSALQLSVRIPASIPKDEFTAGQVATALHSGNKLPADTKLNVTACKDFGNNGDRLLRFTASAELVDAIKSRDGLLHLGTFRVEVRYGTERVDKDFKVQLNQCPHTSS